MESPKIRLSPAESELMQNAAVILTKDRVLEKVEAGLREVQERQLEFVAGSALRTHPVFRSPPKISRGENYLGLPWRILDYPRAAAGNEIFFIRTMFWWGHFFSSTLHLSGDAYEAQRKSIRQSCDQLQHYRAGIAEDPWAHHFDSSNYVPVSNLDAGQWEAATRRPHLKIATRWPLEEWESLEEKSLESWKRLLGCSGLI